MSAAGSNRQSGSINGLTPLLDTVFLLVFALLALDKTGAPNQREPVRVELPLIEQGDASTGQAAGIVLEIGKDSLIRVQKTGRKITSRSDLDRVLAASLSRVLAEEATVEIHADRDARSGTAVALLQHLRLRGFVSVTLMATGSSDPAQDSELFGGFK